MLPPAPALPEPPARPRGPALGLWVGTLLLLTLGAPHLRGVRRPPDPPRPQALAVRLEPSSDPAWPPLPPDPAPRPPAPTQAPGPRGGGDDRGTGTRDPRLPTLPAPLPGPDPAAAPEPWADPGLPLHPASPSLPPAPGGNGRAKGEGLGLGTGRGEGTGPGRGGGRPLTTLPVKVDLRDLGLRGSAVPVHALRPGETFEDPKVVIRLTFGADGTPYRWEPTYGDPRLIPDALRAARKHFFHVPPRLQARAPLQVDLVFRFREAGATPGLKQAAPGGGALHLYEASAFACVRKVEPRYRPGVGEAFPDPRVSLRVFLRENGVPFEAEVLSGDPRLRPSAREAALAHRFRIPLELRRQAPLALLLTFTYQGLPE